MDASKLVTTIRSGKKLSQEFVAKELGLNKTLYQTKENGHISFTEFEISKLSSLFELELPKKIMLSNNVTNPKLKSEDLFEEWLISQYEAKKKEQEEILLLIRKIKARKNN